MPSSDRGSAVGMRNPVDLELLGEGFLFSTDLMGRYWVLQPMPSSDRGSAVGMRNPVDLELLGEGFLFSTD